MPHENRLAVVHLQHLFPSSPLPRAQPDWRYLLRIGISRPKETCRFFSGCYLTSTAPGPGPKLPGACVCYFGFRAEWKSIMHTAAESRTSSCPQHRCRQRDFGGRVWRYRRSRKTLLTPSTWASNDRVFSTSSAQVSMQKYEQQSVASCKNASLHVIFDGESFD